MILSTVPGSLVPHLDTVAVYGPFDWGSAAARRSARILAACAMVDVLAMIQGGASPLDVARFVRAQSLPVHVNLSHAIEDVAHDGTFAGAVFDILCNG